MNDKLFVYGTLAPGCSNEHYLKNIGGSWVKGVVQGQVLANGWGAAKGYPALIPCENGKEIEGLLFMSENLKENWQILDDFEGDGYERKLINVRCSDGQEVVAFVYVLSEQGQKSYKKNCECN